MNAYIELENEIKTNRFALVIYDGDFCYEQRIKRFRTKEEAIDWAKRKAIKIWEDYDYTDCVCVDCPHFKNADCDPSCLNCDAVEKFREEFLNEALLYGVINVDDLESCNDEDALETFLEKEGLNYRQEIKTYLDNATKDARYNIVKTWAKFNRVFY